MTDPNRGLVEGLLHGLYDLAWYLVGLIGSPLLLLRGRRDPEFRRMVLERLGRGLRRSAVESRPRILVHGVSVGEIKSAKSLVECLRRERPDVEIVLSTTTNTGQAIARQLFPELEVVRFPVDPAPVVARFLGRVRPTAIVLVELEIWPNLLRGANRRGIPVVVVNGRITDKSFGRYELFRSLFPQFNRISLFCAQSAVYAERFEQLGVVPERVLVTGNIKFDGLTTSRIDPGDERRRVLGAGDGRPVIVAGSTHDPEELLLVDAWREHVPEARLILVPRHPNRAAGVVAQLAERGVVGQRLTALRQGVEEPDPARPAIVDTIGELEAVFGLADVAFVGGSLIPHGGHNVLEPGAQGLAVVFGPHTDNFVQEVNLLREAGACREVPEAAALGPVLAELCADPEQRRRLGAAAQRAIGSQRGATDLTWRAVERCC
ncbi:MAG: 3-deoxy-D-manno-octulosonic acid transferase [Planctomycetota bacterium]